MAFSTHPCVHGAHAGDSHGRRAMDPEQVLDVTEGEAVALRDSAFARSFVEHQPDLIRFLTRRLRCSFTASELSQEVYLRAVRVEDTRSIRNPRAFFFQVAANLAADHHRVEGRRAELMREAQALLWSEDDERSPERQVLAREELEVLAQVIAELPDTSRRIFSMNRFEGLTQREIAERMGISTTAVEKHIRKVLARLSNAQDDDPIEARHE